MPRTPGKPTERPISPIEGQKRIGVFPGSDSGRVLSRAAIRGFEEWEPGHGITFLSGNGARSARRTCFPGVACLGLLCLFATSFANDSAPSDAKETVLESFHQVSPDLLSTGEPVGEAAFAELRRRGVKTIVSVDGAKPNLELAKRHGMRYVHVPIKYDGITRDQALWIVKATKELPGPVVIHCHHGKHRGPAAVAIACMAREGWTREQALDWLKKAGTSPDYQGLYRDVREFSIPTDRELAALSDPFPESVEVSTLVDAMVEIGERWDQVKELHQRNFRGTEKLANVDPAHEALLVVELYRELLRTDEVKERGEEFVRELESARDETEQLRISIVEWQDQPTPAKLQTARDSFLNAGRRCDACHKKYRNS
ncbi:MAG: hypothetical protein U1D30_22475 [Planctomycetota bacterium]